MELDSPLLDIFVPGSEPLEQAATRTTHLGIGAHADDLEIIAIPGILDTRDSDELWFTGIVVCDGAGSPRAGRYAHFSDEEMIDCRRQEQRQAAELGRYSLQFQLGYSSEAARRAHNAELQTDLLSILRACRPRVVYLHNPGDAHATHRAVAAVALKALRQLPEEDWPEQVYGVEVWGSLDWLPQRFRTALPVNDPAGLQARLLRCHDSQVSGGKRYDEAIPARQRANATLATSHAIDAPGDCVLAMDLRPLLEQPRLTLPEYLQSCLQEFSRGLLLPPQ